MFTSICVANGSVRRLSTRATAWCGTQSHPRRKSKPSDGDRNRGKRWRAARGLEMLEIIFRVLNIFLSHSCLPLGSQSPYTNHGARTSASHCLPADTHFTQVTHHETPSLHCVLHTLFESTTASLSDQSASPKPFIKAPRGFFRLQ